MISFESYQGEWPEQKLRRDTLRALRRCINGPLTLVQSNAHGVVVSGGKCARCIDVARASR